MPISLDNHATTPTALEVVEAMAPYWRDVPWNAHSTHSGGAFAEKAVSRARAEIADLIGASPAELIFTSGATEANNLAILGLASAGRALPERTRILTSAIEHKCVLEAARHLALKGFKHELVPVDAYGIVDLERLQAMLGPDVLLVAVMAANNEIGTIQPVGEVARLAHAVGAHFHVDAAQAVGRIPFDVLKIDCDSASMSAHKMYGPGGIGALYVSAAAQLRPEPILFGGGQEQGLRSGTLPVPLIVGFGRAATLALDAQARTLQLQASAREFLGELARRGIAIELNGHPDKRLPGSLNFRVDGVDAEAVIGQLGDRLHLSTGSACQSGELRGSYVLRALGLRDADVSASFRACFGREHRLEDARRAAELLAEALQTCDTATGRRVQQRGEAHGDVRVGTV
jgi:cysteine desulfurase